MKNKYKYISLYGFYYVFYICKIHTLNSLLNMAEIFRGMEEIEIREVVHVMKTLMKKLYAKAVELRKLVD